jgi:hypothetical protein
MDHSGVTDLFNRMGLTIRRSELTKEWEVVKKGGNEVFKYRTLADARWHWEVALLDLLVAQDFNKAIEKASELWPPDDVDAVIQWLQMEPNVFPARLAELQELHYEPPRRWRSAALKLCSYYDSNPEDAMAKSSLKAAVAIRDRLKGRIADEGRRSKAIKGDEPPK